MQYNQCFIVHISIVIKDTLTETKNSNSPETGGAIDWILIYRHIVMSFVQ